MNKKSISLLAALAFLALPLVATAQTSSSNSSVISILERLVTTLTQEVQGIVAQVSSARGQSAAVAASVTGGLPYNFGGMYGYGSASATTYKTYPNPATGSGSCPSGYTASQVFYAYGEDWPVEFCYQANNGSAQSIYNFGGMYGYGANGTPYPNPATGSASCPSGYSASQVLGTVGEDWPVYFCYQTQTATSQSFYNFGGMYGYGANDAPYPNPATGSASCPSGYSASQVLGSSGEDWPLYFCYQANAAPAPQPAPVPPTVTSCPSGDTGSYPNCVAPSISTIPALPTTSSAFITDLYSCVLGRQPASPELSYWLAEPSSTSIATFYSGFFDSQEYKNDATSNQQYVNQLYNCVLFRAPDAGGTATWLAALTTGMSRDTVLSDFLTSTEFMTLDAPGIEGVISKPSASCINNIAVYSWSPVSGATSYKFQVIDTANGFTWNYTPTSPDFTMPGLFSTYSWSVASCTSSNCSAPVAGNTISCTTPPPADPIGAAAKVLIDLVNHFWTNDSAGGHITPTLLGFTSAAVATAAGVSEDVPSLQQWQAGQASWAEADPQRGQQWDHAQFSNVLTFNQQLTGSTAIKEMVASDWTFLHQHYTDALLTHCQDDGTLVAGAMDDATWEALSYINTYQATNDPTALQDAEQMVSCIYSVYSTNATFGGLTYFSSGKSPGNFGSLYEVPLAIAALDIYQVTGNQSYQADALKTYNWVTKLLKRPDNVFYGRYYTDTDSALGSNDPYNTRLNVQLAGAMGMAVLDARFYKETGNASYLNDAINISNGISNVLLNPDGTFVNSGDPWTNGETVVEFAQEVAPLPGFPTSDINAIYRTAAAITTQSRTSDGYYSADWDGSQSWTQNGLNNGPLVSGNGGNNGLAEPQEIFTSSQAADFVLAAAFLEKEGIPDAYNPPADTSPQACFYTGTNYQDSSFCVPRSSFSFSWLPPGFNDAIQSIKLTGNIALKVCTDINIDGSCTTISSSSANLSSDFGSQWSQSISSVQTIAITTTASAVTTPTAPAASQSSASTAATTSASVANTNTTATDTASLIAALRAEIVHLEAVLASLIAARK